MAQTAVRRWRRRLTGLAALLASLLLLSGCAGFSARVTIVPSHKAYDIDLIFAQVTPTKEAADAMTKECQELRGEATTHDGNTYCRVRSMVPIDGNQTFVKRKDEHWTFEMTKVTLYNFLAARSPGIQKQYPDGFTDDTFDDFKLQVDMPGKVVGHNGDRLDGATVIWDKRDRLVMGDGMHAESQEQPVWKYMMAAVGGLGALALIGGLVFSFVGYGRSRGATRTWPPAHVVEWWERNAERWQRGRPGGGAKR